MKKKKTAPKPPEPPKFDGFKPLAGGLQELRDKLAKEKAAAASAAQAPARPRPAPTPKRAPTAAASPDDELAFHRMMSGVVPLQEGKARVVVSNEARAATKGPKRSVDDAREAARAEAVRVLDHLHHLVDDAARFEVTDDGVRVEGRRVDVSPSLVRTLRRGLLPIDARLDLHGLGVADARERLLDFLKTTRTRGERCVLVIHGKGDGGPERGALRGEISAWLSQGRAREHVAAFATAQGDDGGEGAVYVALRR